MTQSINQGSGAGEVEHYLAHADPSIHILCQNGVLQQT